MRLVFLFPLLVLLGCSKNQPEDTLREFVDSLYAGNCEHAMTLAIEEGAEFVQGYSDAGCSVQRDVVIDTIDCSNDDDSVICDCYFKLQDPSDSAFKWRLRYELILRDDVWKVSYVATEYNK